MAMDFDTLASKLASLRERSSEDTISRPVSQASTSSSAFQFADELRSATGRIEMIAPEDDWQDEVWGNGTTKRRRQTYEWREQEAKAMNDAIGVMAINGRNLLDPNPCHLYAHEAARLTERRAEEDRTGDQSKGTTRSNSLSKYHRVAVELQRRDEDYLQMKHRLLVWIADDEEAHSEDILRFRLRYIKTLMSVYNSQLEASFKRSQENQRLHSPAHDSEERDVEEQKASRGRPRGRPKKEHVEPTIDSESRNNGADFTDADGRGPPCRGLRKTERPTAADDDVPHMNGRGPPSRGRPRGRPKNIKSRLQSTLVSTTPRRSTRVAKQTPGSSSLLMH